jgi:hypothetical protein
MSIPYYGTYKGHPVRVLYREDDLVYLRTADNSKLFQGYLDVPVCIDTWAPEAEVTPDNDELADPPTCVVQPGVPYPCLTCDPYIKGRCQQ